LISKKYQVKIYPRAEKDLWEIKEYFNQSLQISCNKLFLKLAEYLKKLESYPLLFPSVKDPILAAQGYRFISIDNYLIFYVIADDIVQIHRFLYARRDYASLL
jgi:toxin ParE1/3/4